MAIFESAIFWIIVAAASEIIALTPLKSNSVIQLVLQALNSIKPAKKSWVTYPLTGNGYGVSTLGQTPNAYKGGHKLKSFTQLFRTKSMQVWRSILLQSKKQKKQSGNSGNSLMVKHPWVVRWDQVLSW